jgi:hypothetical protein
MKQNKKTRLKITSCKGRLLKTYPQQNQPQGRYIEVSSNGRLHIDWNAEIGNAVPASVWHNIERRIHGNWETKQAAREFIAEHRADFQILVDGMDEKWDGNNYVGTLTPEAAEALEKLEYASYNEQ